ncbi:MAG: type II toxin-antitoxin system RatA family toxin [Saezia sp.]
MRKIEKSVAICYSAQERYDLVIDAESYPQFLPWCSSAEILERRPDGLLAVLGLSIAGIQQNFTTCTKHVAGKSVAIDLVEGPFSTLHCQWFFTPLPAMPLSDKPPRACKIHFEASYEFSSKMLSMAVGLIFDRMMDTFVDAFIKRAEVIYGKSAIF